MLHMTDAGVYYIHHYIPKKEFEIHSEQERNFSRMIWDYKDGKKMAHDCLDRELTQAIVELSKDGFKIEDLFYYGQEHKTLQQFDTYVKRIDELNDIDYPKYYVKPFLNEESINKEQAQLLLDVRQKEYEKRDILSYPSYQIEDDELDDLFLSEPCLVLNTIKLLGKDSFISTFSEKYDNVENNIAKFLLHVLTMWILNLKEQ